MSLLNSGKRRMVTNLFLCYVNEMLSSLILQKSDKFLENNMLDHATLKDRWHIY